MTAIDVQQRMDAARAGRWAAARAHGMQGARDITPMAIGVVPLGFALGAATAASNWSIWQALAAGPLILASAAQLTVLEQLGQGVAVPVVIASAVMVNARILLFGAAFAPWFGDEPLRRRLLLAIPVIDHLYLTCIPRFERGDLDAGARRAYYMGAAVWFYGSWWLAQVVAILIGGGLPGVSHIASVAGPLALVGLCAKTLTDRRSTQVGLLAALATMAFAPLPFQTGPLTAAVVAIVVGSLRTPIGERSS